MINGLSSVNRVAMTNSSSDDCGRKVAECMSWADGKEAKCVSFCSSQKCLEKCHDAGASLRAMCKGLALQCLIESIGK